MVTKEVMRIEGLKKSFGDRVICRGINLSIREGETITILGASGSGKSLLLKMMIGLITYDDGRIYLFGKDTSSFKERDWIPMRRRIGFLFQNSAIFDSISVFDNVAYPLREGGRTLTEKRIREVVLQKLDMVGLTGTEKMYPSTLSGGMRKRVAIARAIATDPEMILYDEPTTGLDPGNVKRINSLILELQKRLKVTSIVVTHDIESALHISDRLALLSKGVIIAQGTKEELMRSEFKVVQDFMAGNMGEEF